MKIVFESELMENQKHATVLSPDRSFDALQTQDGFSLFFSIGTDGVFYLTQESAGCNTGWTRIDLSSALAAQHGGTAVTAKTFDLSQDPGTGTIDMALAVTVGGADFLYLSQGNANTDASWGAGVQWTAVPYDGSDSRSSLSIADVYVLRVGAAECIVVDVLDDPASPLDLVSRYWITPSATPKWNGHDLAADFSAAGIVSRPGMQSRDYTAGMYTFGQLEGRQQLLYTPLYNAFADPVPGTPPPPAAPVRLATPAGAGAIAPVVGTDGNTSLFVAGGGGLYLFTADNQKDGAVPVQVASNPILTGVHALNAATTSAATAVWGINAQDQLFYLRCPAGRETDSTAWSYPLPLLTGVEQMASYLNQGADCSVIFAETSGDTLVRLTQDPVTTAWSRRAIILPSTDPDDVVKFNSYTTHLQVTDDYNVGAGATPLLLTAPSPVAVYLNDVYYLLSPDVAVNVKTDVTGVLTIVQPAHGLRGVTYHLEVPSASMAADVNPMSKVVERLSAIQSGNDLASVQVTGADGTRQPLVSAGVSANQTAAAAQALGQLSSVAGKLPQNGPAATSSAAPGASSSPVAAPPSGAQVSTSARPAALPSPATRALAAAGAEPVIDVAAGDLFLWLVTSAVQDAELVVQAAEDAWHCVITWGSQVFQSVLSDVGTVLQAVEWVLAKIEVGIEDAVKFLGFLFEWGDILRTHDVMKNLLRQSVSGAIAGLATVRTDLEQIFAQLEGEIDAWAGMADAPQSIASYQSTAPAAPGQNSPQANWGVHHVKSNSGSLTTAYTLSTSGPGDTPLAALASQVELQWNAVQTALAQIQTQVVAPFYSLSPTEVLKRLVAIVSDLLLTSGKDLLVALVDVLQAMADGLTDVLDAPISIPILSPLYREISGNDLSLLDLGCLVAAIPATVIFKLLAGRAPFPDDPTTAALIAATDIATLRQIVAPGTAAPAQPAVPPAAGTRGGVFGRAMPAGGEPDPVPGAASPRPSGTTPNPPDASAAGTGWGVMDSIAFTMNVLGAVGTAVVIITDFAKRPYTLMPPPVELGVKGSDGKFPSMPLVQVTVPPKDILVLSSVGYVMYVAPNYPTMWWNNGDWSYTLNSVVTAVSLLKVLAGDNLPWSWESPAWQKYSAPFESVINFAWLVALGGTFWSLTERTASDWLSLVGNAAFDVGGILTPLTTAKTAEDMFLFTKGLSGVYGLMCFATAALQELTPEAAPQPQPAI